MTRLFVTGTGTDIGKTLVTAALCHQLRARGRRVSALKPVMSGYERAADSDAGMLLEALGQPVTEDAAARMAPWRFRAPLSPDMAAAREGKSLDIEAIVAFCREERPADILLIEGIGGAMVPLGPRHTVMDWMAALGAPALVVAGSYLGTLSHTLTTLEAMAARGVAPVGLVISESAESPVPPEETAGTIAHHTKALPIVIVPRLRPGPRIFEAVPDLTGLVDLA